MNSELTLTSQTRRALGLSLALFLLAVYLFIYRGGFHSVDEVSLFAVTESLVKFGRVNTDQIVWTQWTTSQAEAQGFFGPDGHVYSKKGLALSLVQAPLYWLALHLPYLGMLQTVSLLNAFITAATGLFIFMFLRRLTFLPVVSVIVTLIFGLATIVIVYAKYLFSEPLAGFWLLLAAYMLFAYRQEGGLRHVALAGLAAGLSVLTRANNLFLLPVFGLYLLWIVFDEARKGRSDDTERDSRSSASAPPPLRDTKRSRLLAASLPLLVFALAVGLAGAILLAYNALRSGHPLQTGYDLTLFSPNLLLGLYKLLFSPLRGFFIYSPILLLALPGWWLLRRTHPAEAWLFAGLIGVTVILFSTWSSGEGLSWGSRFLVPVTPFFALCLAPIVEKVAREQRSKGAGEQGSRGAGEQGSRGAGEQGSRGAGEQRSRGAGSMVAANHNHHVSRITHHASRFTFYALLLVSVLIQILGAAINPWVFLAQLQTEFGGEFFLEKTAALYDFRYSQIVGQLQNWSTPNSDLAWWQPWGFDMLAFGLSLSLVILTGWQLFNIQTFNVERSNVQTFKRSTFNLQTFNLQTFNVVLALALAYFLLTRYYITDQQFGPPDDPYSRALNTAADQAAPGDQLVTVAPYHYHVPMNRFKPRLPMTGLAQQTWPPPETALPLLNDTLTGPTVWLVTVGLPPAAPDNAAERWLTENAYLVGSEWFDEARLLRFGAQPPSQTRSIQVILGDEIRLVEVSLTESLQAGQILPVEFTWQTLQPPQTDYNLFLQLLNSAGQAVAQHDSPPNGGYSPTSTWLPGQTIHSRHALALPADLPPGSYRLITGLYDPATGARLPVNETADFVDLREITLESSNVQR